MRAIGSMVHHTHIGIGTKSHHHGRRRHWRLPIDTRSAIRQSRFVSFDPLILAVVATFDHNRDAVRHRSNIPTLPGFDEIVPSCFDRDPYHRVLSWLLLWLLLLLLSWTAPACRDDAVERTDDRPA
jgi:hypothetical protein